MSCKPWLVLLVAVTCVSGENKKVVAIVVPSVIGGLALIAAAVAVLVCIIYFCHRRVTSLEYTFSTIKRESTHDDDEKTSLVPHEYDPVCTDGGDNSRSSPQLIESQYSVVRADLSSSKRGSRSRSESPDTALTKGIRNTTRSYGAVDHETEEDPYSYIRADKQRYGGPRSSNVPVHPRAPSAGHTSGQPPRSRPSTSIYQTLKHCQSGTYVPSGKQRTQLLEPHYETESSVYNRLEFFETGKDFWSPAQTTSDLYGQLSVNRYREIPRQSIIVLQQLGSGQFGTVCRGLWTCDGDPLHVAVKFLPEDATEGERVKFLQEAALMGQFSHPHIISLYGVVTVSTPTMIVLELATTDLHKYLRGIRFSQQYTEYLPKELLRFSLEIASGMEYLSKKCFMHRDLAARNILLDFDLICKIGDFGMARDLMDEQFYTSTDNRPLPIKWMAPESLLYRTYSSASDVWSYGMVLYEIWSMGRKPYEDLTNQAVIDNLQRQHCHPPPPGCPRAIYTLMVGCWHPEANERVTFHHLHQRLCQPEEYLLSWSDDESSSARQLGADHTHSRHLYADLQTKYLLKTDAQTE